jgi:hypothetical protein
MKRNMTLPATVFLGLVLVGVQMSVPAAEPGGMEDMIRSATTRADHEALAEQFEAHAKDLLARADEHERMGKRYEALELGAGKGPKFAGHCRRLADNLRAAAKEDQELAALHRELAAGMQK